MDKVAIFQQRDFYTLEYIESVWGISKPFLLEQIKADKLMARNVNGVPMVMHANLVGFVERICELYKKSMG
jgi:hypothetical protein